VPAGALPGSPTIAVVPFAETATDEPNAAGEAGGVRALPVESDVPLYSYADAAPPLFEFPSGSPASSVEPLVDRATAVPNVNAVAGGVAPVPRFQRLPFVVYVVTQPNPFPPVGSPTSAVEPS